MSMIAPESYIEIVKDLPYKGLIQERDKLIKEITDFEQEFSCASEDPSELLGIDPSPDVVYRMQLLYLAKLLEYMESRLSENENTFNWNDDVQAALRNIASDIPGIILPTGSFDYETEWIAFLDAERYEVTCTIPHRDGAIMVQFIFDTGLGGRPAPKVDENAWYSLSSPEPSISDEVLTLEMNNGAMLTWDFKTRKWKE